MAVSKLIVLGREIELPVEVDEREITKESILSLLRDLDADLAREVEGTEYDVRIEGKAAVVYRLGATFG